MIERLQATMATLEGEVASRTRQLSERVEELKKRSTDERLINQLLTYLQGCESEEEVFRVVSHLFEGWAPESAGLIWRRQEHGGQDLLLVGRWGLADPPVRRMKRRDCFVARQGVVHDRTRAGDSGLCDCMGQGRYAWSICLPIKERGDVIVIIQVMFGLNGSTLPVAEQEALRARLMRIVEPLGLALQNLHLRERLRDQSIRDSLTGLYNRRFLDDRLNTEISRCERNETPLAVLLIDVDYFKNINDTWGHPVGDRVLIKLAALMHAAVRESDLVCRYGGEEFVMVLPDITPDQAIERAESLRQRVEETAFIIDEEGNRLDLTISIGVAWYPDMGHKGGQLIRAADIALYRAKRGGRNRVEVARELAPGEPEESSPPAC
ncbi:MAG: GGDEF domain-containing protein [Gammaproteobacteria bacterium]|nr:MAG: GGDEF domain-containing protein [Gammaproteobacteria bacterium]